ncbi:MAG: 5'/3'-nucleotidase SurE [Bdellovibrionota bacterium]
MKKTTASKTSKKLHFLLSNDDGVESQGLLALADELKKTAHVTVVAPEREQSTMGHALTLHKPVRLYHIRSEKNLDVYALSGTPADCVCMGLRKVLKKRPDAIISGINRGLNLGNDVFYSGTVAAAREGALLKIPAIAASMDFHFEPGTDKKAYFDEAATFLRELALKTVKEGIPERSLLNVNFPNLPLSKVKGVKIARQGFRIYSEGILERTDQRKKNYYWLGGEYEGFEPIKGLDCVAVDQGYISVTPLRIDITQYDFMESLEKWHLPELIKNKSRK